MAGDVVKRGASTRGRNGRYAKRADTAERDAEACRLRTRGMGYLAIAEQLGYFDQGHAYQAVQRALKATMKEAADEVRQVEIKRLDDMFLLAVGIAERFHVTVSNGRVVYTGNAPVKDDLPALAAIDRLLRIQERRARYLGLDAPTKTEVRHVDAVDAEIEQLVQRLAHMADAGQDADVAAPAPESDAERVPHPG